MSEERVPVVRIQEPTDMKESTESQGACASSDSGYDEVATDFEQMVIDSKPLKVVAGAKSMAPALETIQDEEFLEVSEEIRSAKLASKHTNLPAGERVFHSVPDPTNMVKLLYDSDEEGNTSLHKAIAEKNQEKTVEIVRHTPSACYLNLHNIRYSTPLHIAVEVDFIEGAAVLLTRGANLVKFDSAGNTPLHIACYQGNATMLQVLRQFAMEAGLRLSQQKFVQVLETRNYDGASCFHLVTSSGDAKSIKLLSSWGVNVNAGDAKSGRTALHFAVEADNELLVKYLLSDVGVDVNSQTYCGDTALTLARGRNLTSITQLLEKHGAVESEETKRRQAESDADSDMDI